MKISEIIQIIRNRLNDRDGVGDFEDDQLVDYLNQAISYISAYLVTTMNPLMVKSATLNDGDELPEDFIKTCGNFPMLVEGRTVELFNPKKPLDIKYYFQLPKVDMEDDFPLKDLQSSNLAIQLAVIFCMNQQRIDVGQDQAIATMCMDMVSSAYGYVGAES